MRKISKVTDQERETMKFLIEQMKTHTKLDVTERSRERDFVYARKVYMWVAKKVYGLKVTHIGESVGLRHDTAIYHIRTVDGWVNTGDKEIIRLINKVYNLNIDVEPTRSEKLANELKELRDSVGRMQPFIEVLNKIPEGREQDVADRLELFIRTLNMDLGNDKIKIYEGHSAYLQE